MSPFNVISLNIREIHKTSVCYPGPVYKFEPTTSYIRISAKFSTGTLCVTQNIIINKSINKYVNNNVPDMRTACASKMRIMYWITVFGISMENKRCVED